MFMEFMINVNVEKCFGCVYIKEQNEEKQPQKATESKKVTIWVFWLAMTSQG